MAQAMTQKFWLVTIPENQRLLERAALPTLEITPCPATDRHHGRAKRTGQLQVIADPRALKDFTWTWMTELLISPKVLKVFEKHHITGFDVRPVIAQYPKPIKARPPELYEVIVTGWAGLPSPEAKLIVTRSCRACGDTRYSIGDPGKILDPGAWDGSDLFIVWPFPRHPFASDRLASIIRQEKLFGVKLMPPAAIAIEPGDSIYAGSLFEWLPEERAEVLSQQLGIC
jgi:hypothetical protein